jgi:putative hemolysin
VTGSSFFLPICRATRWGLLVALAGAGAACASTSQLQLANPASQNCVAKGGQVVMEKNPRGALYGVCLFDDNRQCEEWAMLRGECRTGGIKVTGYATPAARYCAITGGTYVVTGASQTPAERGDCTLPGGRRCSAAAYYDGSCTRQAAAMTAGSQGEGPAAARRIRVRFSCAGGTSIDATFIHARRSSVQLVFSDGRRMTLPQALSADGGRYANEGETIVFWNKGRTAFVQENGKTTYADCLTRS